MSLRSTSRPSSSASTLGGPEFQTGPLSLSEQQVNDCHREGLMKLAILTAGVAAFASL
jgi:hypothetical protein